MEHKITVHSEEEFLLARIDAKLIVQVIINIVDNAIKYTPEGSEITTTLKTHEYRYLTAPNGEAAIMEASSHNPDVILLDLGLPDMDGVKVIRQIRTWSNVPIIVISARSEDTDKIEALDAGADDYLTKPFSVEELLARLRVTRRRLAMMQSESLAADAVFTTVYIDPYWGWIPDDESGVRQFSSHRTSQ